MNCESTNPCVSLSKENFRKYNTTNYDRKTGELIGPPGVSVVYVENIVSERILRFYLSDNTILDVPFQGGGTVIAGVLDSINELPTVGDFEGQTYIVKPNNDYYYWKEDVQQWINLGNIGEEGWTTAEW